MSDLMDRNQNRETADSALFDAAVEGIRVPTVDTLVVKGNPPKTGVYIAPLVVFLLDTSEGGPRNGGIARRTCCVLE